MNGPTFTFAFAKWTAVQTLPTLPGFFCPISRSAFSYSRCFATVVNLRRCSGSGSYFSCGSIEWTQRNQGESLFALSHGRTFSFSALPEPVEWPIASPLGITSTASTNESNPCVQFDMRPMKGLVDQPAVLQPAAFNASGSVTNDSPSWSWKRCMPVTL